MLTCFQSTTCTQYCTEWITFIYLEMLLLLKHLVALEISLGVSVHTHTPLSMSGLSLQEQFLAPQLPGQRARTTVTLPPGAAERSDRYLCELAAGEPPELLFG